MDAPSKVNINAGWLPPASGKTAHGMITNGIQMMAWIQFQQKHKNSDSCTIAITEGSMATMLATQSRVVVKIRKIMGGGFENAGEELVSKGAPTGLVELTDSWGFEVFAVSFATKGSCSSEAW
jgi:hypothetical protein